MGIAGSLLSALLRFPEAMAIGTAGWPENSYMPKEYCRMPPATALLRASSYHLRDRSQTYFPRASALAPRKRPRLELLSGSWLADVSCSVQSLVSGSCAKPQGSVAQATTQLGRL